MFSSARFLGAAALLAALAAPAAAFAQQAPAPPAPPPAAGAMPGAHHHHHGGAYMRALHTLTLSDAQRQSIEAAMQSTRQANQNADPATHKANTAKLHAQIEAILTPDQRTQLQAALRQQRSMQGAPGMAPMAPGPVPAPAATP